MSDDGIILNPGVGGSTVETTELASGNQLESVRLTTISGGNALAVGPSNPLPVYLVGDVAENAANATQANVEALLSKVPDTGQSTMQRSLPVTVASDQSPMSVRGARQTSVVNSSRKGIGAGQQFTGQWEDVSNFESVRVSFFVDGDGSGISKVATLEIQWADAPGREPGTQYAFAETGQSPYSYQEIFSVFDLSLLTVERATIARYFRVIVIPAGAMAGLGLGFKLVNPPSFGDYYGDGSDSNSFSLQTTYSFRPKAVDTSRLVALPRSAILPFFNDCSADGTIGSTQAGAAVFNTYLPPKYGGAFSVTGYLTSVVAAAKAANTLLMSAKVTTSNGLLTTGVVSKVAYITRIRIRYAVVTAFAAAAVPATLVLQRHTGTTPTGGTVRTPCLKDDRTVIAGTTAPIAALDNIRDLNAALTGAPTFGTIIDSFLAPAFTVSGSYADWVCEWDPYGADPLRLANGSGIALRVGTAAFAATATWMFSYTIEWLELVF